MPSSMLSAAVLLATALYAQDGISRPQESAAPQSQNEIHVDERCRIYTQDRPSAGQPFSKAKFRRDDSICRFGGENHSAFWEQNVVNGVVRRTYVHVVEHEYLLHDTTAEPVVFLVDQYVPEGWYVDSDPQPDAIVSKVAIFRIFAQPGQTVRLHVGERR